MDARRGHGGKIMKLMDEIVIDCPSQKLYTLISDVERHASLLPGYIESRIVAHLGDACILQREALINGKRRRWKSKVQFVPGCALHFTQMEGPLIGMHVLWSLQDLGDRTR